MTRKKTIVHITTVHDWRDPRILEKQCAGAAGAGHDVSLIACEPVGDEYKGVRLVGVKHPGNRLERIVRTGFAAYRKACFFSADVYHFHDPEFLPWALLLREKTAKVIYDIHEDYITSVDTKHYLPGAWKQAVKSAGGELEKRLAGCFHTVAAEKYYLERFPDAAPVLNYPVLPEGWQNVNAFSPDGMRLLYTGNISEIRGALHHAGLVDRVPGVRVTMAGYCRSAEYRKIIGTVSATDRLDVIGVEQYVPFERIGALYQNSQWLAGLALFPYSRHYRKKILTKFFEYMMWGLPIVCTDFPVWKALVEKENIGICVDPADGRAVSDAIAWLAENPEKARAMGLRGKALVAMKFNWDSQLERLLEFYEKIG